MVTQSDRTMPPVSPLFAFQSHLQQYACKMMPALVDHNELADSCGAVLTMQQMVTDASDMMSTLCYTAPSLTAVGIYRTRPTP